MGTIDQVTEAADQGHGLDTPALAPRLRQVNLNELAILDTKSLPQDSELKEWPGLDSLFVAESCARTLFIGSVETFAERIPPELKMMARRNRAGGDAYEYLLRVATGLESKNKGEYDVLGQIRNRWKAYQDAFPTEEPNLFVVMQHLFADAKLVREEAFRGLHEVSEERCAIELAGVEGGEKVLVIADRTACTERMVLAVASATKQQAGHVTITHPDNAELDHRWSELRALQREKKGLSGLSRVDFATLEHDGFDAFDHVFICAPMAPEGSGKENPLKQVDDTIITLWQLRGRSSGNIVHLRGNPFARGATSSHWDELHRSGLFTPDHISRRYSGEIMRRREMFQRAEDIIKNCIHSRLLGEHPDKRLISLRPQEYAEEFNARLEKKKAARQRTQSG